MNTKNFKLVICGTVVPPELLNSLEFERKISPQSGKTFLSLTACSYRKLLGACMLLGIDLTPDEINEDKTLE